MLGESGNNLGIDWAVVSHPETDFAAVTHPVMEESLTARRPLGEKSVATRMRFTLLMGTHCAGVLTVNIVVNA